MSICAKVRTTTTTTRTTAARAETTKVTREHNKIHINYTFCLTQPLRCATLRFALRFTGFTEAAFVLYFSLLFFSLAFKLSLNADKRLLLQLLLLPLLLLSLLVLLLLMPALLLLLLGLARTKQKCCFKRRKKTFHLFYFESLLEAGTGRKIFM